MIDQRLIDIVARQEGKRLDVYKDSEGYWTIGHGCCISRDKLLTEDEARFQCGAPWDDETCKAKLVEMLRSEEAELEQRVAGFNAFPDWVRRGLVDMAYQLGTGGVMAFKRMLEALQRGDYPAAEQAALQSEWHRQTPSRCEEVARMIGNKAIG